MILRRIGAVVLGLIVTVLIVQIAELGVHAIAPPPPGMSMRNMETVKAYVAALPLSALLLVLVGSAVGVFVGAWLGAKVGHTLVTAYIVGALFFVLGIYNAVAFPQPIWYSIALAVLNIAAPLIAARLGAPQPAAAPAVPPA